MGGCSLLTQLKNVFLSPLLPLLGAAGRACGFFVVTGVWLGLGFSGVFKGHVPSRTSERAVGRGAAIQAGCTHAGKSIFQKGGCSAPAGIWLSQGLGAWIPGIPDPGTCIFFPQGWQTGTCCGIRIALASLRRGYGGGDLYLRVPKWVCRGATRARSL